MKKYLLLLPVAGIILAGCSMQNNNMEASPTPDMMMNDSSGMESPGMMGDDTSMEGSMEQGVMVGGAMMVPSKNIVENAMNSNAHTTLVSAVQAAGLAETLQGPGPFTVFAPTNAAFDKLPAGTVDDLMMAENRAQLTKILTYHAVPGRYTSADLEDGMTLKTVQGQNLTVKMQDGQWMVVDAKGNQAMITTADVMSSNGVTFVVDSVLMPQ